MTVESTEVAKALIVMSDNVEEADKTVEEYLGFKSPTFKEKIAFLKGLFGDNFTVMVHEGDSDEFVYNLLLHAAVESKWNS